MGALGLKCNFPEHGHHVAYQIEGDGDKNRIQVKFSPSGQTGEFGWTQNHYFSWGFAMAPHQLRVLVFNLDSSFILVNLKIKTKLSPKNSVKNIYLEKKNLPLR